jgi:DNA-binding NtrC family response regulator
VTQHIVIVEPDVRRWQALRASVGGRATVDFHADFVSARASLDEGTPSLIFTNLRLGEYNGLHLVHVLRARQAPTRAVVYGQSDDTSLGAEARSIGAFFIPSAQLAAVLPSFIGAELPQHDRRSLACTDRRRSKRGGRRATDLRSFDAAQPPWGQNTRDADELPRTGSDPGRRTLTEVAKFRSRR